VTAPATPGPAGGTPAGTQARADAGSISPALRLVVVAVGCFAFVAELARGLVVVDDAQVRLWYVGLGALSVALFVLAILRTPRARWAVHALLVVQCLVILVLVLVETEVDFTASLFVPLAAEAAVVFTGRTVWGWVGAIAALTTVPLLVFQGLLDGLAVAAVSVAPEVVLAACVVVARELESARHQSQVMLDDLRAAQAQLEEYAAQAGRLAAVGERDRVARDLNDSVAARIAGIEASAQEVRGLLAAADAAGDGSAAGVAAAAGAASATGTAAPAGAADAAGRTDAALAAEAAARLAAIQADTQQALADMRGLIAELRPAAG